jgi:hypothetical protein
LTSSLSCVSYNVELNEELPSTLKEVYAMKLSRLNQLNRAAADRFTEVEKVTTLSHGELKRVIGGAEIAPEAHAHYHYNGTCIVANDSLAGGACG